MTRLYEAEVFLSGIPQGVQTLSITPDPENEKIIVQAKYPNGKTCSIFLNERESKAVLDRLQQSIAEVWG